MALSGWFGTEVVTNTSLVVVYDKWAHLWHHRVEVASSAVSLELL